MSEETTTFVFWTTPKTSTEVEDAKVKSSGWLWTHQITAEGKDVVRQYPPHKIDYIETR